MRKHDVPNEWGFAGEGTAPEPPYEVAETEQEAQQQRAALEHEEAEETAVPGRDLTTSFSEALADATTSDDEDERR